MQKLTMEQEDYLEEEAMEKYYKKKGYVVCQFCGLQYQKDLEQCPECDRQIAEVTKSEV